MGALKAKIVRGAVVQAGGAGSNGTLTLGFGAEVLDFAAADRLVLGSGVFHGSVFINRFAGGDVPSA